MIGDRIRRRRQALGLSQAELAEGLFDRSYISRVENNIVVPPLDTLRLIAKRLQVSIDVLLANRHPEEEKSYHALFEAAKAAAAQGGLEAANGAFRRILLWAESNDEVELKVLVLTEMVRAHVRSREYVKAASCMHALFRTVYQHGFHQLRRTTCFNVWMTQALVLGMQHRYNEALNAYQMARTLASTASERAKVLWGIGTARLRMGHYDAALQAYQEVLDWSERTKVDPVALAACYHGAGTCCYRLGRYRDAIRYTRRAMTLYRSRDKRRYIQALHNVAVYEIAEGYHSGLRLLRRCAAEYWRLKDYGNLAGALEELAGTYHSRRDYAMARRLLRRARFYAIRAKHGEVYVRLLEHEAALPDADHEAPILLDIAQDLRKLMTG